MAGLKKAGANWVDGERFFDREAELAVLSERVRNGTHTLLTAQRRMGKTSLVRELLRRLKDEGRFRTVFVDLEDARTAADAVVEIAVQSRPEQRTWYRIKSRLREIRGWIDTVAVAVLRVKLRAGVDAGNWRQKGDEVLAALADHDQPVVLALDELPILVNRMLKDDDYRITPEGRRAADEFLSWLRRNGQTHQGRICLIISGSVGLEPILRQAGLSATANIFSPLDLKPWDERTALDCLAALAEGYGLDLPLAARQEMCRRLRCLVPHHVQCFFDSLDEDLRLAGRRDASEKDVERIYTREMLGVRGQADLDHYKSRLELVLGSDRLSRRARPVDRGGSLQRRAEAGRHRSDPRRLPRPGEGRADPDRGCPARPRTRRLSGEAGRRVPLRVRLAGGLVARPPSSRRAAPGALGSMTRWPRPSASTTRVSSPTTSWWRRSASGRRSSRCSSRPCASVRAPRIRTRS